MQPDNELNARIAEQIGHLIIENHALKIQVQRLMKKVGERPAAPPADEVSDGA